MSIHFIGVDAGGTSTRAIVAREDGSVAGVGRSAGANSWSSGASPSAAVIEAVSAAIGKVDPATVAGSVIAIAGGGSNSSEIAAEFEAGWRSLGVSGSPAVVVDVVAAYAAGTSAPRGLVLAAGTGAIAAVVSDGRLERRSGGHGYLVGDEDQAVWLGIEAVRAVLMSLDGRGPETSIAAPICEALGVPRAEPAAVAEQLVTMTYSRPPAQLGQLAPLVVEVATTDDVVARRLVAASGVHLSALALAVAAGETPPAVVLAGSLLTQAESIRREVREQLAARWPLVPLSEADEGQAGAVALAMASYHGASIEDGVLDRLREGARRA